MFRYITAGESHGRGLMAVIEGVPAGLRISEEDIDRELKRRMRGYGRGGRMSIESDKAEIISGCRKGRTIGSPLGITITNRDFTIDSLPPVIEPRPGHADLAGMMKYGFKDGRDVLERASARETAARTAVGAVAKVLLNEFGIGVASHVLSIGSVNAEVSGLSLRQIKNRISRSERLNCADPDAEKLMIRLIEKARDDGDTLGGVFEVIASPVPPGLGSYVHWDRRIDSAIARAIMSIPAVKAVSMGRGVESSAMKGSEVHDEISYDERRKKFLRSTNNAGGTEGGITNGEDLVVRGYMKPIPTLRSSLGTVNIKNKKPARASRERSDVCAVPACGVIAEGCVAIELATAIIEKFGADSIRDIKRSYDRYVDSLKDI